MRWGRVSQTEDIGYGRFKFYKPAWHAQRAVSLVQLELKVSGDIIGHKVGE